MNTIRWSTIPLVLLASALLLASCDAHHDQLPPEATTILGLRVMPDPIPAGTEAALRLIISDSTAPGLKYIWLPVGLGIAETSVPEYLWKAPAEPGIYRFEVYVKRLGGNGLGYRDVGRVFHLNVVSKP